MLKEVKNIAELVRDESSEETFSEMFRKKDARDEESSKSSISGSICGTEEVKQEVNDLLATESNIHSQQYEEETKEYNQV